MKDKFKKLKLGEILTILTDYHANGSYELLKKNVKLKEEPDYAIMIRTTNFENNDFSRNLKYITENAYNFLKKSKVFYGDILMNKIANAGSVYHMPILNQPVSLAMNLFLLRINTIYADQSYVFKYLKCNEKYIKTFASGTAAVTITKKAVRNLDILLPPLPIQKKIAAVLSAYDDLIENNNHRISLLEKMAEEVYKEWFVRLRFPGHDKVKIVKGIPEGWTLSELGKFFKIVRGCSYKSEEISDYKNNDEYNNFITLKNFKRNGGYRANNEKFYKGKYVEEQLIQGGDLIMAITDMTQDRAIVGRVAYIPKNSIGKSVISCDVIKLIPIGMSNELLYSILRYSSFSDSLKQYANGANVLHLKPEMANKQRLLIPDKNLLDKFENIITNLYYERSNLYNILVNLKKTRERLLPRLMSGKIDVENLDIAFPASMKDE